MTGSVLVEMSYAQFNNLTQLMQPLDPDNDEPAPVRPQAVAQMPAMVLKKRLESVRRCLSKLRPSSLPDLQRTIRLVCSHTGGVRDSEVQHIINLLQKERYLQVLPDESVVYF